MYVCVCLFVCFQNIVWDWYMSFNALHIEHYTTSKVNKNINSEK